MSVTPLILIDGSSYLFRAYHAMPELTNHNGEPTGAIYGVINMLKNMISQYQPTHMAVVFDPKGDTVRHTIYPEYKANRAKMPEELAVQIPPLFKLIEAMGLPLVVVDGVEADDVIGTIAKQHACSEMPVMISTGDKDMAQLVDDHISLINTMTGKRMDREGVYEKFGVYPDQIIDYLALMGDAVDNIPGVPKVGPKTAAKWIAQYGSLDALIAKADEVGGKVGENLRAHLGELPLSRQLVTIDCDISGDWSLDFLKKNSSNSALLRDLYQTYGFRRWLAELSEDPVAERDSVENATPTDYRAITTKADCLSYCKKLEQAKEIALDTETTSLNPMLAELVGISLSITPNEAVYIPLTHIDASVEQLDKQWVLDILGPILNRDDVTIVGQNLKYDLKVLAREGLELQGPFADTLLESYVMDSSSARHDLDTLAMRHLNRETISYESVTGKGAKQKRFDEVSIAEATSYASEDADIALQLHQTFGQLLAEQPHHQTILDTIEMPLMPILANMELTGVLVDADQLLNQSASLAERLETLEKEIFELAGEEFNISSPKQLQVILFEKLNCPVIKKTPKGQPSTNEEVLQVLSLDYPLPKRILEFRSLSKLKSTYTDKLPKEINPETGRVHTSYLQAGTATGRLASKDPNLQNIPIKTKEGRQIRQAFIAPSGKTIVAADYSQIELRLMAHLSQDPSLLKAFANNQDVHAYTASEVFGVPIESVTESQRRSAKAINFGLMYGMSGFGLAKQLGLSRKEADQYINVYFERYPKVLQYMEEARESAAKQGFVETLCGRRLNMPGIHSKNAIQRKAAERAAINAPLQGSAADIIKLAMIKVTDWIEEHDFSVSMIMQVHDELVFEVAVEHLDEVVAGIRQAMESALTLSVPLIVDIGHGKHWDEAH